MVDDIDCHPQTHRQRGRSNCKRPRAAAGPGGGAVATFTDPVGNLLGLYQDGRS